MRRAWRRSRGMQCRTRHRRMRSRRHHRRRSGCPSRVIAPRATRERHCRERRSPSPTRCYYPRHPPRWPQVAWVHRAVRIAPGEGEGGGEGESEGEGGGQGEDKGRARGRARARGQGGGRMGGGLLRAQGLWHTCARKDGARIAVRREGLSSAPAQRDPPAQRGTAPSPAQLPQLTQSPASDAGRGRAIGTVA